MGCLLGQSLGTRQSIRKAPGEILTAKVNFVRRPTIGPLKTYNPVVRHLFGHPNPTSRIQDPCFETESE